MAEIIVHEEFKFSPDGREVVTYAPGEHTVTEQCAQYAHIKSKATLKSDPALPSAPPPQPEILVPDAQVETEAKADPLAAPGAKKAASKAKPKSQPKAKKKS